MPMTRWYMLELCNKDIKAAIFKMQASNSEHSWNKFNIKCNCKNIEDIKDQMESTVTKINGHYWRWGKRAGTTRHFSDK